MKKKTKFIWILIISLLLIVVGYMRYYPIKHELLELQHIIEDKLDVNTEKFTNIGLNNKDFYYFVLAGDNISLDESYKNMFGFDKYKYVDPIGVNKDFVIVSSTNHDEKFNYLSADLYYVNKNKPGKVFLFNSLGYDYELRLTATENEFILSKMDIIGIQVNKMKDIV